MYINEIDKITDKILDDYYINIIKSKKLKKPIESDNFVKYQSLINDIFTAYFKTINKKEIRGIVNNEDNVTRVFELIKKYIGYYTFLTIGLFNDGKEETFINNVIEFSKNQGGFELRIKSFFNSNSTANIIKLNSTNKQTQTILEADQGKLRNIIKMPKYKDTIDYLNSLGNQFVTDNFKLENIRGNKHEQVHNMVKTIILKELYQKQEKQEIYEILESVEKEEGEYTYIDIILPRTNLVDYNEVENILTLFELKKGFAPIIYNMIMDSKQRNILHNEEFDIKIKKMINSGLLLPVVDDFLLYHKDTERYEKMDFSSKKGKENTKIKYIINKIDKVSDYYSKRAKEDKGFKKQIEHTFYSPFADRKAILVNDNEENKIIKKLLNIGKKAIENNQYYDDLITYRKYPYINFKELKSDGFPLKLDKTIDAIRHVSFERLRKNPLSLSYSPQFRIGSNNMTVNIVGFVSSPKHINLMCKKMKNITNIRNFKKVGKKTLVTNGYKGIKKYIKYAFFQDKKMHPVYWKIRTDTDKVDKGVKYEITGSNNTEHSKMIVSSLYDDIVQFMYAYIMNLLDKFKTLPIYRGLKLIEIIEDKIFELPKDSNQYNELRKTIFMEKYEVSEDVYDKKEDFFFGLYGDVNKLIDGAKYQKEIDYVKIKIDKEEEIEKDNSDVKQIYDAVCQHFVTWDNIMANRKRDPNKFTDDLVEFTQRYVVENKDSDYICRSCGTQIPVKNFIAGGLYDKSTGQFRSFYTVTDTPINELYEYRNYSDTIINIEKLIDKIASIANITHFIKNSKNRIIKNVVDMVIMHNKNLENTYKKRNLKVNELYGIDNNSSNIFVFKLDNDIFVYTSKEKDHYKLIKRNNILVYILFALITELNKSQILYLADDKTCNYYLFEKYGFKMFDNLKVIINDTGEVKNLQDYSVLCYVLYYLSCISVKYSLWSDIEDTDVSKKKKRFNPVLQKNVIHTMVDIMNSIFEINKKKDKHYLYGLVSERFFYQLSSVYNNEYISELLKSKMMKKIVKVDGKTSLIKSKIKRFRLTGFYKILLPKFRKMIMCRIPFYVLKKHTKKDRIFYNVTNITNCADGEFHNWVVNNHNLVCTKCNISAKNSKINTNITEDIMKNYMKIQTQKVSQQYCKTGLMHTIKYSDKEKCDICSKCDYIENKKLSDSNLLQLNDNIKKYRNNINLKKKLRKKELKQIHIEKQKRYNEIIKKMQANYNSSIKNNNKLKFLDNLINVMQNVVGESTTLIGEQHKIYLDDDIYLFDHDKDGLVLNKPIFLKNTNNQVKFKQNHGFFKTNVLYYTNFKKGRIDIYYDAINMNLLGYKEENKDYVVSKTKDRFVQIIYSIKSKLKLMGYPSRYVNIRNKVIKLQKIYKDNPEKIGKTILSDLNRNRNTYVKKLTSYMQRSVFRLRYKYKEEIEHKVIYDANGDEIQFEVKKELIEKYRKGLSNFSLRDKNKKNRVFNRWEKIVGNINYKQPKDDRVNIDIKSKFIDANDLHEFDYQGNLLLFYITTEMIKLINYNHNRFTKINIIHLFIDIINKVFNLINADYWNNKSEIKSFKLKLRASKYREDLRNKGKESETNYYGEYQDEDDVVSDEQLNAQYTAKQEFESIDAAGENGMDDVDGDDEGEYYQRDYDMNRFGNIYNSE